MERGSFVAPQAGRTTLAQAAHAWTAGRLVRPSTARRDTDYLNSLILPHLGAHELRKLTPALLRSWIAELSATKAPSTVVKAGQIVSMVLQQAAEDRLIDSNPMRSVRLPRVAPTRRRALTDREVAQVASQLPSRYQALVLTMAFCALRPGEAVALETQNVDLLRRQLTITHTAQYVGGKLEVGPPKTPAGQRTVPIPAALNELLAQHIATYPGVLLFAGPSGTHLRMNNWQRRHWAPALANAGIEPIDLHQLRHTGITRWAQEGIDPATIAKRAGHESVKTVLDIYARALEGHTPADDRIDQRAAAVIAEVHGQCTPTTIRHLTAL